MTDYCQECLTSADEVGVRNNGARGVNITRLCSKHAVIFRARGPRALPNVWKDAVMRLALRLSPAAGAIQ